ncbi:hypothetical protein BCY84_05364 [Trypanosoma cruzi cruzi]|uniref:Putative Archaic translocase of outer membrane 12 kDa subunit n=1 Tax=Trypanosoma cruzi TaxID=5693 RepID=A0A2V2VIZ5_TRYCR|nr:putative Archaic translocase of outer membrane 12 kDa subunit [Trypanosoma cruzi]PBJ77957.1 hypothetical protein BCY84_05364 [Trypanosoma cruzi cruzi]PWU95626.1 putative Archaic translocase of outer membrane 12 kDa subunit [Trypanosoma cruzi]
MMLDSGAALRESRWSGIWRSVKSYTSHVGWAYLEFATPVALFFIFNMALDMQDTERFGLAWIHYSRVDDEREREEKFPAYEPGSAPQVKRVKAATTTEYIASTA